MYVLDTSVVLKWFVEEEDYGTAREVLKRYVNGDISLAVPDLLIYEIGNVLKLSKGFTQKESSQIIEYLIGLKMDIIAPISLFINRALEVFYREEISFYDSVFVALAELLECKLITADKKLFERVKKTPKPILLKNLRGI